MPNAECRKRPSCLDRASVARGAAVLALSAFGIQHSALTAAQQPIFRSGVELVRFDLRVTDADGRPVTDLRPDEVQIVEDGKVRPLLLFQHIQEPAGAYADAAMRAVSAEVTTNRGTPRGHLYMLIFDQQHIAAGNEQIARRAAEAFIRTRVRPSDRVAVFGVPGPGPQIGFTADRTRAIAALSKVHGTLERNVKSPAGEMSIQEAYEIASGNERLATEVIGRLSSNLNADVGTAASFTMGGTADRGALRASDDPAAAQRIIQENARFVVAQADSTSRQFLQRMSDLIAQYRDIEGRKTVVLFSEGFHDQNVTRELEQVAAAASESYAVFVAMDLQRRAGDAGQLELPSTDQGMEIQSRLQPLSALAAETDGTLIIDAASHVEAALDRLAERQRPHGLRGPACRGGIGPPPRDRRRHRRAVRAAGAARRLHDLRPAQRRQRTAARHPDAQRQPPRPRRATRRRRYRLRRPRHARRPRRRERHRDDAAAGAARSRGDHRDEQVSRPVRGAARVLSDARHRPRAGGLDWKRRSTARRPLRHRTRRHDERSRARLRRRCSAGARRGVRERRARRVDRSVRAIAGAARWIVGHGVVDPCALRSSGDHGTGGPRRDATDGHGGNAACAVRAAVDVHRAGLVRRARARARRRRGRGGPVAPGRDPRRLRAGRDRRAERSPPVHVSRRPRERHRAPVTDR
ncbi:MAG: hypothetical protein DMF85_04135, partial [Acidobacteria bacterium]